MAAAGDSACCEEVRNMRTVAIVLAGGKGSRMKSEIKKQYLLVDGKPVLWYSLDAMERCGRVDEVVLVCGRGEQEQCRREFVERYGFQKIRGIVEGGKERYHSVYEGLKAAGDCTYVLIHDGARPFVDAAILDRILDALPDCRACVAGMPVKDTIKLGDPDGFVEQTLPRERLWTIQTPQAFSCSLIRGAYEALMQSEAEGTLQVRITDDAMVAEQFGNVRVKLIEGSYDNIKITTPEDLFLAEEIVRQRR